MDIKYWKKSEGSIIRSIDDWVLSENLEVGDVRLNGGAAYFCWAAHLSAANYEPGVGADWEDVWKPPLAMGVQGIQGIPGGTLAWKGPYNASTQYAANDGVLSTEGRAFYALQSTKGNAPPTYPTTTNAYWSLFAEAGLDGIQADGSVAMTGALTMTQIATPSAPASGKTAIYAKSDGKIYKYANGGAETEIGSGAGFWSYVPGTPTRVSDTSFSVTDTGNANKYDKIFTKGTILKWLDGATFCTAMVVSASYGADAVTISIVGDSLTAGFTAMKYCIHRVQQLDFILPGTIAVGTDLGRTHYATCDLIKLAVDVRVKTAGATNATTIDINDDGSTIITTKPSISDTGTSDIDNVCDAPTTVIAAGSAITLDVDAVTTTAPVDLYATLYVYPEAWRYIA